MPPPARPPSLLVFSFALTLPVTLTAEDTAEISDGIVMMEAFSVSAYGGKIPIIDGFTRKDYLGENQVVFDFANTFNKLLLGFHKKLVLDEHKHMQFRIQLGGRFEQEMNTLSQAFEFGNFKLDRSQWLSRERSIVSRLINKPFFKIHSLVAWDLDHLNEIAPENPKSKYADDIRFNPETQSWERRITAKWDVLYQRNAGKFNSSFFTSKEQGLNLDTLRGFHFIERGLPSEVPSYAFKDVKPTYPIFYSDDNVTAEELTRLQKTFVANLYFIYDPFSWVARRDTRFRGGFNNECQNHVKGERIYVSDRKWFDPVFARFLSDVVTIKLQGAEEIYSLHMLTKRLGESPRYLGLGLDVLNWNKGEDRAAKNKPESVVKLHHKNSWGVRYLLIDAYQRHGDELVNRLKTQLLAQKESRRNINGQAMIEAIIEELSGLSYDKFGQRAMRVQEAQLAKYRITK